LMMELDVVRFISMNWALITGASSGIGRELALLAAADGYGVVLVAIREGKLQELAKEIDDKFEVKTHIETIDLAAMNSADVLFDSLAHEGIVVDVLVNNAGFGLSGNYIETDAKRERQMIDLNISALTRLTRLFLLGMLSRQHGYIMQVASVAGFFPGAFMTVYYATKAYVLNYAEGLARELKGTGVHVCALCPGVTKTEFFDVAQADGLRKSFKGGSTAHEVAQFGWDAMKRKKVVAVHGFRNRLFIFLSRFVSRAFARSRVADINK